MSERASESSMQGERASGSSMQGERASGSSMQGERASGSSMQTDLRTRAQLAMLAGTMDVDPDRLAGLGRLEVGPLRSLRERISDVLFDEQAQTFARVSRLAPLVPNALVAKLSETLVPPLVAGRAAGALGVAHPDRAAGVLSHLSSGYLADCAPYLDPRTIGVLAPVIPVPILVRAANELMVRRDHLTAARFLDYAGPELVREFERGIPDDVGLLMTAALTDSNARLAEIVALLPRPRLEQIVRAAATGEEPLVAGLSILARLPEPLRAELSAVLLAAVPDDRRPWALATATTHGARDELRTVAAAAGPAGEPLTALLDGG